MFLILHQFLISHQFTQNFDMIHSQFLLFGDSQQKTSIQLDTLGMTFLKIGLSTSYKLWSQTRKLNYFPILLKRTTNINFLFLKRLCFNYFNKKNLSLFEPKFLIVLIYLQVFRRRNEMSESFFSHYLYVSRSVTV